MIILGYVLQKVLHDKKRMLELLSVTRIIMVREVLAGATHSFKQSVSNTICTRETAGLNS